MLYIIREVTKIMKTLDTLNRYVHTLYNKYYIPLGDVYKQLGGKPRPIYSRVKKDVAAYANLKPLERVYISYCVIGMLDGIERADRIIGRDLFLLAYKNIVNPTSTHLGKSTSVITNKQAKAFVKQANAIKRNGYFWALYHDPDSNSIYVDKYTTDNNLIASAGYGGKLDYHILIFRCNRYFKIN